MFEIPILGHLVQSLLQLCFASPLICFQNTNLFVFVDADFYCIAMASEVGVRRGELVQ